MDKEQLTRDMRWEIAAALAEERLDKVNQITNKITFKKTIYSCCVKRIIDILVSVLALIITLPINVIIGIITYFDVGRPIFFKQIRVGRNGKEFQIVKFRNMKNTRDKNGDLLPPSQRVTKFGKFVRKTSLDELLNFWCILKGDMSLFGPRPLGPEYIDRYSERHKQRLLVRPGLECPPRKHDGKVWTWQEQFENDVWYVEHVSFITDCKMFINLIRFALDKKSANARALSSRGIFMGYGDDGCAITLEEIPQEYVDKVLSNSLK